MELLFPVLQFDTYLQGPSNSVNVLGATDRTHDLPPPGIFDSDKLAVAFGISQQTIRVARFD